MRWLTVVFLVSTLSLLGQVTDTIYYKNLVAKTSGPQIKIKYKSAVTGQKITDYLQDGQWLAYDSFGNVLIEANYKANKVGKFTRKHGPEIFLHPETGDTILVKEYNKGALVNQLAFSEAIFVSGNKTYHTYKDFGSFSVIEYRREKKGAGYVDFTSIWKSSIEDPNNILGDSAYLAFEDSMGDASLLQPARFSTKAQYNYVSNPEFENHPGANFSVMSFKEQLPYWSIASESPDFYLSNKMARSGRAFVGFRVFSMKKHIEYLQNQLKKPLEKDKVYCFSAHLKLSPGSKYATNAFGFLLSDKPVYINTDELLTIQPSKRLEQQVLNYKSQWMKVQCTYTAKGGEQFLVLGSFQNHKDLELVNVPGEIGESYYYLDDVSLVPVEQAEDCACNFSREAIAKEPKEEKTSLFTDISIGEKLVLDDIHFENDEAELLPESFTTLGDLLNFMQKNATVRIEISGHTSSLGGLQHNVDLSKRRAEAVKAFLTLNGIEPVRIETQGFGPKFPIATDDTEAGQKQNRRVEFKLLSL
jgi:OOP family OmpA-OmpF porin